MDDLNDIPEPQLEERPSSGSTPKESDAAQIIQVVDAPPDQEAPLSFTMQFESKAAHLPDLDRTTVDTTSDD